MTNTIIKLGGRSFVQMTKDSTVQHDLWLMQRSTEAGLAGAQIWSGETPEAFAQRLLEMAIKSGVALELLGGLLVPEGTLPEQWTPEMAAETTLHLGRISVAEEKQAIYRLILTLLIDFFAAGLISSVRSRSSSADQPKEKTQAEAAMGNGAALSAP